MHYSGNHHGDGDEQQIKLDTTLDLLNCGIMGNGEIQDVAMGWERGNKDTNTIIKYTNTLKKPSTACTILENHHGPGDEQHIENIRMMEIEKLETYGING